MIESENQSTVPEQVIASSDPESFGYCSACGIQLFEGDEFDIDDAGDRRCSCCRPPDEEAALV